MVSTLWEKGINNPANTGKITIVVKPRETVHIIKRFLHQNDLVALLSKILSKVDRKSMTILISKLSPYYE
jgi:hypothetical protein